VRYEDLTCKYWLSSIEIPDDIRRYSRNDLPAYWQDKTYERTQYWLRDWLIKPDVLAVGIPSVIVPFSYNIILHPRSSAVQQCHSWLRSQYRSTAACGATDVAIFWQIQWPETLSCPYLTVKTLGEGLIQAKPKSTFHEVI
jgi:hypothetical protein